MRNKILAVDTPVKVSLKYPEYVLGTPTYETVPMEDIKGHIVAVRAIVNVKVEDGKVKDPARLEITAKDLAWILDNGGTPVFWGHNGRATKTDMLDFDTEEGQIVVQELNRILKEKYGHELNYVSGVVTSDGVNKEAAKFVEGKANMLNNIRVFVKRNTDGSVMLDRKGKPVMDHSKPEFTKQFKEIFKNADFDGTDVRTFFCSAYGDIGSAGPASHVEFLEMFKNVAWGPVIVQEILDTENIKDMQLIQFAGNKLDKIDALYNLKNVMNLGGVIYLGSAIAAQLLHTDEGIDIIKELAGKFNILRVGDEPDPNAYNLAIPEVTTETVIDNKDKVIEGAHPDITPKSMEWLCDIIGDVVGLGDRILFNGIPSWREARSAATAINYIESTKRIIHEIAEKIEAGSCIDTIGGDGPANFKEFAVQVLKDLSLFEEQITEYSGGGVPLKYATIGLKKLVIAQAMHDVNASRMSD